MEECQVVSARDVGAGSYGLQAGVEGLLAEEPELGWRELTHQLAQIQDLFT